MIANLDLDRDLRDEGKAGLLLGPFAAI